MSNKTIAKRRSLAPCLDWRSVFFSLTLIAVFIVNIYLQQPSSASNYTKTYGNVALVSSVAFRSHVITTMSASCVLPVGSRVSALDHLALRRIFSWPWLVGEGLEIGALQQPFSLPAGVHAQYVDSKTIEQLRAAYPELANVPLVSPDIVDRVETLGTIANASFDFVIASHVIEHAESPILAIVNMLRVVRTGGVVVLVAPMKCETFDRHRNLTLFSHMFAEYTNPAVVMANHHQHFREFVWSIQLAELNAAITVRSTERGANAEEAADLGLAAAAEAAASNLITIDEARAQKLNADEYAIHFHTFDQVSFLDFLTRLAGIDGVPRFAVREYAAHKYESLVVLQKI